MAHLPALWALLSLWNTHKLFIFRDQFCRPGPARWLSCQPLSYHNPENRLCSTLQFLLFPQTVVTSLSHPIERITRGPQLLNLEAVHHYS